MKSKREVDSVSEPVSGPVAGPEGKTLRQNARICPYCSREGQPVLLEAARTEPYFTRYYCARRCGYAEKIPRPRLAERLQPNRSEFEAR